MAAETLTLRCQRKPCRMWDAHLVTLIRAARREAGGSHTPWRDTPSLFQRRDEFS